MVNDMDDDIVRLLREQERILGEMRDKAKNCMDDLLRDALNQESFLRYIASLGIDLSQILNLVERPDESNPYKLLGLEKTATDVEVKKRYREMLFRFHPDTAEVQGTGQICQKITEAYQQIAKERRW